jgi:hypothetical protein
MNGGTASGWTPTDSKGLPSGRTLSGRASPSETTCGRRVRICPDAAGVRPDDIVVLLDAKASSSTTRVVLPEESEHA